MNRLPVVGVMGSGHESHGETAAPLGKLLASLGVHLLTGGGGGVMRSVSESFVRVEDRPGLCLGILPGSIEGTGYKPPDGYPNEFVEIVVRTHLPGRGEDGGAGHSRNWINVLTCDALVFLPGGPGTGWEERLARQQGKPAIKFGGAASAAGFEETLSLREVERFLRKELKLGP